jgi:hypothetical protein
VTFRSSRPRSSDFAYSSPSPRNLIIKPAFNVPCSSQRHRSLDIHQFARPVHLLTRGVSYRHTAPLMSMGHVTSLAASHLIWLWLVGEVPVHAPALETVWEILLHGVAGEAGRPPAPLLLTHLQDLRHNTIQHIKYHPQLRLRDDPSPELRTNRRIPTCTVQGKKEGGGERKSFKNAGGK